MLIVLLSSVGIREGERSTAVTFWFIALKGNTVETLLEYT